jgi:hypothetical protein
MLLALMISLYYGMDTKIGPKPKLGFIAVVFKRIIDRLFSQKDERKGVEVGEGGCERAYAK